MVEKPHGVDDSFSSSRRKQVALEFHHRRLLRRHIQQWQLSSKWSRDVGWKEDLAFHHHCGTLLLKCMAGWNLVRSLTYPSSQWPDAVASCVCGFYRFNGDHGLYKVFCQSLPVLFDLDAWESL